MSSRLFARLWIALTVFVLIAGATGLFNSAQALEQKDRRRGLLATAQLFALIEGTDYTASCSSTVVDPAGYILTAYHCVGVAQIMLDFGEAEAGQVADGDASAVEGGDDVHGSSPTERVACATPTRA